MGEFSETFKWKLRGTKELLYLTYKGHVIAPTFKTVECDSEIPLTEINFGIVSYQFEEIRQFDIVNTSSVDFTYRLHTPGDKTEENREFWISPQEQVIRKEGSGHALKSKQ